LVTALAGCVGDRRLGHLMLKYWLTGKLNLLIHPDYWLVIAGAGLLVVGGLKDVFSCGVAMPLALVQHITLFPLVLVVRCS